MSNIEQLHKSQCFKENCQYFEKHCIVYRGYDCIKLGGNKIPTHRSLGHDYSYPIRDPLGVGINDGWQTREGR